MRKAIGFKPRILGFLCNWCCYAGADLAGVARYQYPPYIRAIRLMCSGRVDMAFVLRAFMNGTDGVFIGGCWLGECHYITEGNHNALSVLHICKKILKYSGINPARLRLEWVSASEGIRFAEVMSDFAGKIKALGPIGQSDGSIDNELKLKLHAATKLIPYIKLVERERLRVRFDSEAEYEKYFNSDEVNRLFEKLIAENLTIQRIMAHVRGKAPSRKDLSDALSLTPSETARYLNMMATKGLVQYDSDQRVSISG